MYEHLAALDDMHKRADTVLEDAEILKNKMKEFSVRYLTDIRNMYSIKFKLNYSLSFSTVSLPKFEVPD